MKFERFPSLDGPVLIKSEVRKDIRGFFYENFNEREFERELGPIRFVQDNHSFSWAGVLRGLHYQLPNPQGKLVRVVRGQVWDVVVDLRRASPTFGNWMSVSLWAHDGTQLWVPPGFAHGFYASMDAELLYKTTAYWDPEVERCIRWDDPDLAIAWPFRGEPVVSERDESGLNFTQAPVFGEGDL